MDYEKFIKDERGKIRIKISLVTFNYGQTDHNGNLLRYDVRVWHTPPKKRNEIGNMSIATQDEILAAKMELWNSIKP